MNFSKAENRAAKETSLLENCSFIFWWTQLLGVSKRRCLHKLHATYTTNITVLLESAVVRKIEHVLQRVAITVFIS
jgi:hypothetical protein